MSQPSDASGPENLAAASLAIPEFDELWERLTELYKFLKLRNIIRSKEPSPDTETKDFRKRLAKLQDA